MEKIKKQKLHEKQFIVDGRIPVKMTKEHMQKMFFESILMPWFMVAKRLGLPKDISRLIARSIPKNYVLHPVWEFIDNNVEGSCCCCIYKKGQKYLFNPFDGKRCYDYSHTIPKTDNNWCKTYIINGVMVFFASECRLNKMDPDFFFGVTMIRL